jgi:hypothetical protein
VSLVLALFVGLPLRGKAQKTINVLEQNISIMPRMKYLEVVLRKICDQFNLDLDYNSS